MTSSSGTGSGAFSVMSKAFCTHTHEQLTENNVPKQALLLVELPTTRAIDTELLGKQPALFTEKHTYYVFENGPLYSNVRIHCINLCDGLWRDHHFLVVVVAPLCHVSTTFVHLSPASFISCCGSATHSSGLI